MIHQETFADYQAKFAPPPPPEQVNAQYAYVILLALLWLLVSFHITTVPVQSAPIAQPASVSTPMASSDDVSPRLEYVFKAIWTNARAYDVDPQLAFNVAFKESTLNPFAGGEHGPDRGLFQIQKRYQDELVRKYLGWDPKGWFWWDAECSAALGCAYLSALIKKYGAWGGVASYNAGPNRFGGVEQFKYRSLPDKTWGYVHDIFGGMK
jgi:soluble lytic murein transglycosylase-like protein